MIINWYQTVKGNSPKFAEFLEKFSYVQKGIEEGIAYEQDKYNKKMEEKRADNYSILGKNSPRRQNWVYLRSDFMYLVEDKELWGASLLDVFEVGIPKTGKSWVIYAAKEKARWEILTKSLFPIIDATEVFFECGYGENHPVIASIRNFVSRRTSEDQKMNLKAFTDIWTVVLLGGDAAIEYDSKLKEATYASEVKITDWKPAKTLEELQNIAKAFDAIDCGKFADYYELFEAVKALPNL